MQAPRLSRINLRRRNKVPRLGHEGRTNFLMFWGGGGRWLRPLTLLLQLCICMHARGRHTTKQQTAEAGVSARKGRQIKCRKTRVKQNECARRPPRHTHTTRTIASSSSSHTTQQLLITENNNKTTKHQQQQTIKQQQQQNNNEHYILYIQYGAHDDTTGAAVNELYYGISKTGGGGGDKAVQQKNTSSPPDRRGSSVYRSVCRARHACDGG